MRQICFHWWSEIIVSVFPQESLTESPSYQLAPVVHDETEELAPLDLSTSNPQDLING